MEGENFPKRVDPRQFLPMGVQVELPKDESTEERMHYPFIAVFTAVRRDGVNAAEAMAATLTPEATGFAVHSTN